jgi:hypothetical protein
VAFCEKPIEIMCGFQKWGNPRLQLCGNKYKIEILLVFLGPCGIVLIVRERLASGTGRQN